MDEIEAMIAAHGYRLAWSRRAECPCRPADVHLTQSRPDCDLCDGTGSTYFSADEEQDLSGESFTPVQMAAIQRPGAFVIRGTMYGISTRDSRNEVVGSWIRGGSQVTVLAENRLGSGDRLVNLDAQMPYTEIVTRPPQLQAPLPLRYLVSGGVFLLMDENGVRYRPSVDFDITVGQLVFQPNKGPKPTSRMTVHYLTFPVWMVDTFNHRERIQFVRDPKTGAAISAEGAIQRLPIQATLNLEFIPSTANDGGGD